jgi:acyl-CoA thioesterase II
MSDNFSHESAADLVNIVTPEPLGNDRFLGHPSSGDGAAGTFGGHFLGQAAAAALATVDNDRHIHSFHAYFLRGGEAGVPIEYVVDRLRDGRSFGTRRVTARQHDKDLFTMMASVAVAARGPVIAPTPPADFADLPDPETLPRYHDLMATRDPVPLPEAWALREHGIDTRVVNAPWSPRGPSAQDGIRMWIRTNGKVADDPALHAALLAYQSDESISDNVLVPFNLTWGSPDVFFVSLDHAMWFHQPVNLNHWHFVEQAALVATGGRGIASGTVWTRAGQCVATFTQEALMRVTGYE